MARCSRWSPRFIRSYLLPDSLLRLVLWMATHSLYRIRVEGRENIPETGGALFVSNHMSFVDALPADRFDRPAHPLPDVQGHLRSALRKAFRENDSRDTDFLGIAPARNAAVAARSDATRFKSGEVVCIFAEGQITRIGQMLPFRRGMERIMKGVDAPIVPVNLDGVWGSIFSFERGRFLWKIPRSIPYPVTVSFGKPMPPTSTPFEVREAVQQLQTEAYQHRKESLAHAAPLVHSHRPPVILSVSPWETSGVRA